PCAHRELQEAAQRRLHGCAAAALQRQDRQEGAARPILAWARAAGFLDRDQTFAGTRRYFRPRISAVARRRISAIRLASSGELCVLSSSARRSSRRARRNASG